MDQIVAVCTCDQTDDQVGIQFNINFFTSEGTGFPNTTLSGSSGVEPTVMEWQPNGRILAIGWSDGMVSCWTFDGRTRPTSSFSNSSQHHSKITVLKWNPAGKRMVTGDRSGVVNVWTADARGTLTSTRQYRRKGEVTAVVYCTLAPRMSGDNQRKVDWKKNYSPSFFIGTDRGGIVFADDLGHCTDVQQLPSPIDKMLFYEDTGRLVILTKSLMLTQYQVAENGLVTKFNQVKISVPKDVADNGLKSLVWAGSGLLAAATQEKMVRAFNLISDENYNLSLSVLGDIVERSDRIVSVAFNPIDRYLACGTQGGIITIWKYVGGLKPAADSVTSEERNEHNGRRSPSAGSGGSSNWELCFNSAMDSPVQQLCWSNGQGTLTIVTETGVRILSEAIMQSGMCGDIVVQQTSRDMVVVNTVGEGAFTFDVGILVRGISVGNGAFVVWSGKFAAVHTVNSQRRTCEMLGSFKTNARCIRISDTTYINDDVLFAIDGENVVVLNHGGVQRFSLSFTEAEGVPELIDLQQRFLVIVTNKGVIKVFDVVKPTKPVAIGSPGKFNDPYANSSELNLGIRSISVNCKGTMLAIMADRVEGALKIRHPDSRLHVFDTAKGLSHIFDFGVQKRFPANVFWDAVDDRLCVVDGQLLRTQSNTVTSAEEKGAEQEDANKIVESSAESEILIFFVTSEYGIKFQDSFPRVEPFGKLVGIAVPRIYFGSLPPTGEKEAQLPPSELYRVHSKLMRDFEGLRGIDDSVKAALLEVSFNLSLGKLDEAYKAVKLIDSPAIWENMANKCVKTKRIDVAEVCLGNMKNARGVAALRKVRADPGANLETQAGVLALQLGQLDEAAKLFIEGDRHDYLNKMYQSAGQWEKAIRVANTTDRLHLKTSHFQYAKYLESIGSIDGAIEHFELSDTFRVEVPRMMYQNDMMDSLEDYVNSSKDTQLFKWWAAYLESQERYDYARKYYARAEDYLSLVRLACFQGDFQTASDIVHESGDPAASYHFARQLEAKGELRESINYYASSGCYNHAIRLARAYGLDAELMRFATKSTPSLMLDCGAYFEAKGDIDNAVQLYHKGGDLPRALDLCFRAGGGKGKGGTSPAVFDMLNVIAKDLGADSSPQTLARCAEFLMQNNEYARAVDLYIMAKRYPQAIEMCSRFKVPMTDDMADKLTPPAEDFDPNERKELLKELASALKKQGNFTLASKKYTLAGDRIKAMKCLQRAGDTKAVIQFASISRSPEIYKLAGNYLQQMNWRESVDIMKAIIMFYTKAKAFEQLAGFYDSCAQVEIDEYRDYEKALGALRESQKYLEKAEGSHINSLVAVLDDRIMLISKFVEARKMAKRDPSMMVNICQELLEESRVEEAIRIGDCLAMLVEFFHAAGKMKEAYGYMRQMTDRNILLHPYLDASIIDEVYKAVGVNPSGGQKGGDRGGYDGGDDEKSEGEASVGEEIDEEVDEESPVKKPARAGPGRNFSIRK